jgi:competence protein ComEA
MTDPLSPGAASSWPQRIEQWRVRLPSPRPRTVAGVVVAALAGVVGLVALTRQPAPPPPLALPRATPSPPSSGQETPPAAASTPAGSADGAGTAATVTVHAAGAVTRPGVYAVAAGARVADVVATAGGPLPDADLDQLNLAAKVVDAQRIYVPHRGEAVAAPPPGGLDPGEGQPGPASPLDLNTATAAQLDALPGIGPALAAAIVEYRTKHGPFRSVTGLLDVPGIGPAKLDAIRALVRAGQ